MNKSWLKKFSKLDGDCKSLDYKHRISTKPKQRNKENHTKADHSQICQYQ